MNNTITVVANDTPHTVDARPINLLCHDGSVNVSVPDAVEINPAATVALVERAGQSGWTGLWLSARFMELWRLVWADVEMPERLDKATIGMRHVAGMIVMLVGAQSAGKRAFLRLPETYLHPKQQCGLADLLIKLSQ